MTAVQEVTLNCDAKISVDCHHWIQTDESITARHVKTRCPSVAQLSKHAPVPA